MSTAPVTRAPASRWIRRAMLMSPVSPLPPIFPPPIRWSINYPARTTSSTIWRAAYNAFLTKIGPGGTNLIYSTYFGGNNVDVAMRHRRGQHWRRLSGWVHRFSQIFRRTNRSSRIWAAPPTELPATTPLSPNSRQSGTNLIYSTFLGGTNNDFGYGVAVDSDGNAYV